MCSFEVLCDLYDTFNWHSNWFHLIIKEGREFL